MGAYRCEFGIVHKVCRCPTPHTIKCDRPSIHAREQRAKPIDAEHAPCWRIVNEDLGKHELHEPHEFWYTSSGGGHYLDQDPGPDTIERNVRRWICPGRP